MMDYGFCGADASKVWNERVKLLRLVARTLWTCFFFIFRVIAVWAPRSLETSFAVLEASVMWQLRHWKVDVLMPGWADCFVYGTGQYVYTVWQPARHMCAPHSYVQLILMQRSTEWMWLTAGPKGLWLLYDFTSHWRRPLGIQMLAVVYQQTNFLLY